MGRHWIDAAAEILEAPTATTGRARLAAAITDHLGAVQAVRMTVPTHGEVVWGFFGSVPCPPAAVLPSADDIRTHPLHRFHAETGHHGPMLMADALHTGRSLRRKAQEIIERLHLTTHQVSMPLEPVDARYHGWTIVSDTPMSRAAVESLGALQSLIRGLERHLELLGDPDGNPTVNLTSRERVVLAMLARGSTARGIAAKLLISPRTVHKHQENLYRKLGAVDRLSAVLRAQECGLLPRATRTLEITTA